MEEHVYQLRTYLPVRFEDEETNDFVDYLVSAYLENLTNGKYQFSFTAFHMLYMCFIYKIKWFLKQQGNAEIDDLLLDYSKRNSGASFNTLFDLSQISEKSSLEKLLKTLSFHANDVDLCKNLVEVRNKCSHASGKIYFKRQPQVENYILEEIDSAQAVHKKIKPYFKIIFDRFLNDNWSKNWIENDIKNWILENYLSQRDIDEILQLKPLFLKQDSDTVEILYKKILYCNLVGELIKYTDDNNDFFVKSLSALMKGLPIEVDIKINPADDDKKKSTRVIIEEKILPLLTELPDEISNKAQEVLKYSSIEQ